MARAARKSLARAARALAALLWLAPAVPAAAADATLYRVDVELDWAAPPGLDAHWSRLVAFAHSPRYSLFEDGATASSGLALVATNGRVAVLEAELDEGRRRGRVGRHVVLPGIGNPGSFSFTLPLDDRFGHVSFATMLAPSPDWFTGVSGADLRPGGEWRDGLSVALWPWDAGADSGAEHAGPNIDTQPRQSVRLLAHPGFLKPDGLRPVGRATFTRLQ